jgi:hypothetical protein
MRLTINYGNPMRTLRHLRDKHFGRDKEIKKMTLIQPYALEDILVFIAEELFQ